MGLGPDATRRQKSAAIDEYEQNWRVILPGYCFTVLRAAREITWALLLTEFLTRLVKALRAVLRLAQTRLSSFRGGVGFVTVAGVLAAITGERSVLELVQVRRTTTWHTCRLRLRVFRA
jgi:hypothetical protein